MSQEQGQNFLHSLPRIRDDLPVSPAVLREIFHKAEHDSSFSLESISRTVASDQSLTTKVLARANSAYYGFEARISTVSRALSLLGLAELRRIILTMSIGTLSRKIRHQDFDLQYYWEHQSFTALMARETAIMLGRRDAEDLMTCGLLHDLGKIITAIYAPEVWQQICAAARKEQKSHYIVETEFWGIDHALIGAMVLHLWHLPESLTEPVNWHHRPELADTGFKEQARILALANNIEHSIRPDSLYDIDQDLHRILGLHPRDTRNMGLDIITGNTIQELKQMFAA